MFRHQLLNFLKTDLNPKIKTILGDLSLVSLIIFSIFSWINYANPIYIQPTGTFPDPQALQLTSKLIPRTFLFLILSLTSLLLFLKDKIKSKITINKILKLALLFSIILMILINIEINIIIYKFPSPFFHPIPNIENLKNIQLIAFFIALASGIKLILNNKNHFLSQKNKKNDSILKFNFKTNKKIYLTLLFLIITLFIAVYPLIGKFLNGDEWHVYNLAKTITETGQLQTQWNFLYNQPDFLYYPETPTSIYTAIWFFIFGESTEIAHLASFSIAILFIVFNFQFLKSIFNKHLAILFSIFFTTTPFFVFQSIYIRGYIYILTATSIIIFSSIKLIETKKKWDLIKILLLSSVLILITSDMRSFAFLLFIPLILGMLLNIKNRYVFKEKTEKIFLSVILFIIAITITFSHQIFSFINKYYSIPSEISINPEFSWIALERSIFNFNPQIFILIFLISIIFSIVIFFKKIKLSTKYRNFYFILFTALILNFIFGFLAVKSRLIPRYMISLIFLNFLTLFFVAFEIIKIYTKSKKLIYFVFIILIISTNLAFWKTSRINHWSSGYNYTDIYDQDKTTKETRLKEKTEIMYAILEKEISNPDYKKVALMTEYISSPENKNISYLNQKITLLGLRYFDYASKFITRPKNGYNQNDYKDPINKKALKNILGEYDLVLVTYPTRKAYKFEIQNQYLKNYNFQKISGKNIDNSGIEIYKYSK
jgi:hypothetical protein